MCASLQFGFTPRTIRPPHPVRVGDGGGLTQFGIGTAPASLSASLDGNSPARLLLRRGLSGRVA